MWRWGSGQAHIALFRLFRILHGGGGEDGDHLAKEGVVLQVDPGGDGDPLPVLVGLGSVVDAGPAQELDVRAPG